MGEGNGMGIIFVLCSMMMLRDAIDGKSQRRQGESDVEKAYSYR